MCYGRVVNKKAERNCGRDVREESRKRWQRRVEDKTAERSSGQDGRLLDEMALLQVTQ